MNLLVIQKKARTYFYIFITGNLRNKKSQHQQFLSSMENISETAVEINISISYKDFSC